MIVEGLQQNDDDWKHQKQVETSEQADYILASLLACSASTVSTQEESQSNTRILKS